MKRIQKNNVAILAIDIDGTLIPNSSETPNIKGIKKFGQLVEDLDAVLVYPTGRTFQMACKAIGKYFLPMPDFLIASNGIFLFSHNGAGWTENLEYKKSIIKKAPNFDCEKIIKVLSKLPFLQEEEATKQDRLKAGFYVDLEKKSEEAIHSAWEILNKNGINNTKIIYSQDLKNKVGILEILPDNISKLTGIEYLAEKLELNKDSIIFAGDEGNDLDVFASGIPSILVGNARDEIRRKIEKMNTDSIYFAKGENVEGIIEGIKSIINVQ